MARCVPASDEALGGRIARNEPIGRARCDGREVHVAWVTGIKPRGAPSAPRGRSRSGRPGYAAQWREPVAGHASGPSTVSGTIMLVPNCASTSAWLLHQPSYTWLDIGSGKM